MTTEKEKRDECVTALAGAMIKKLDENDDKRGWDEMAIFDVYTRIRDELVELENAYQSHKFANYYNDLPEAMQALEDMKKEAIDVANFLSFLIFNIDRTIGSCTGCKHLQRDEDEVNECNIPEDEDCPKGF